MVGSAGDEKVGLTTASASYTLYGSRADDLRSWPGIVCVSYDPAAPGLPGHGIRITSYRLQGDGKHAPIVGTIAHHADGRFELRTDDGKRFTVRDERAHLDPIVGRHIWLIARWNEGAMEPIRLGLLGSQT